MPASQPSVRALTHTTLTETVNRIDVPYSFLTRFFMQGRDRFLETEEFEIGFNDRGRVTAPFTREGATATYGEVRSSSMSLVRVPSIRLKKAINAGQILFNRRPGERVFGAPSHTVRRQINEDLVDMTDSIANTIEWMTAQVLKGTMTYSVIGGDSFTISFNKPADVTLTPGVLNWNGGSAAFIEGTFRAAKKALASAAGGGYALTDAIMSSTAADAFLQDTSVLGRLDANNYRTGSLDLTRPFVESGTVNYLGRFIGVDCWEYSAQLDMTGSNEDLIRDGFVEFVSRSRKAQWQMYWGPHTDIDAIRSGNSNRRRFFSKTWTDPDPGHMNVLVTGRPLPFVKRPESMISYDVSQTS